MCPALSYTIWFSQRTGSTLLCRALESTGVAGRPGEHLYAVDLEALYARHGASTPNELRARVWAVASTPNRVLGLKHGIFEPWFTTVLGMLGTIPGHDGTRPGIWANAFPNGRHIFMTRRDKVRLAVSWWKAIQSQEWHRARGAPASDVDIADRYSFQSIDHLLSEAALREAATQEFFAEGGIVPLTVVYEDFVARYEDTISDILHWLGLEAEHPIAPPAYERLSDSVSENWVQRFRRDKQAGRAAGGRGSRMAGLPVPATLNDVPAIEHLITAAYAKYIVRIGKKPAPMLDDYRARVAAGMVWIVRAADGLAGLVVLVPEADHLLLDNIAVSPAYQGRGIGRSLMAFTEDEARRRGLLEVRLYTHALMHENLRLYAWLGYRETGRAHQAGYDRVFMAKHVS